LEQSCSIEAIVLLEWLKNSSLYPKFYWASQNGAFAAAGSVPSSSLTLFWGNRFVSPAIIQWGSHIETPCTPITITGHTSIPEPSSWNHLVEEALSLIRQGPLQKVVLARKKTVESATPFDPFALCAALKGKTVFLIQEYPTRTFFGASPEMLYRRTRTQIECDALAGTRPLDAHAELLYSAKDQEEFFFVHNFLLEALHPFCSAPPRATPLSITSAATVCHLHTTISGTLRSDVTDRMLLLALHPTPAVGGFPRKEALQFLAQKEPFARGLYAAPIGWMNEMRAEFAVGIRSASVEHNLIHLYAGAGIVRDSDPMLEWKETEQKLALWNRFFTKKPL
jgi:menaquinone-specific isochorismate synthase